MTNITTNSGKTDLGLFFLILFAIVTFAVWQFPFGRIILYPFVILGTWFHEMGHGLCSIALGGHFIKLEMFADGSGIATHTDNLWLGNLGRAIVAAAGPIGPTIAGSFLIIGSSKTSLSRKVLMLLGGLLILSAILWIRTLFGFVMILIFGMVILFIAIKGKDSLQKPVMQFLGIQAFLSLYLSIGYLFSSGANISGSSFSSDTQVISANLFFPNWFWAGAILLFSLFIIISSIYYYLKNKS